MFFPEWSGVKMSFSPRWVFEAGCAAAGSDYLKKNTDLNTIANSCAAVLSEFYEPVHPGGSGCNRSNGSFLDELKAGEDAEPLLISFCYNQIYFERSNKPRKMKGLLGTADEPVRSKEYSPELALKSFKAFVYSLRNDVVKPAPVGWKISDVDHSKVFQKLASQQPSPLDYL